jgi:hypothetical protein
VPANPADISVLEDDDLVCGRSLKVVQAVADRAKCRFAIPAIDGDGPGGVLDRGGGVRERDNLPSPQEPDQAGLVTSGQPVIARVRSCQRYVEAEQVAGGPTERLRLFAQVSRKRRPSSTDCCQRPSSTWSGQCSCRMVKTNAEGFNMRERAHPRSPSKPSKGGFEGFEGG